MARFQFAGKMATCTRSTKSNSHSGAKSRSENESVNVKHWKTTSREADDLSSVLRCVSLNFWCWSCECPWALAWDNTVRWFIIVEWAWASSTQLMFMAHSWIVTVCDQIAKSSPKVGITNCIQWPFSSQGSYYGYTNFMSWTSGAYECRLCMALTWSDLNLACIICTVCKQSSVDGRSIAAMTNKKCAKLRTLLGK